MGQFGNSKYHYSPEWYAYTLPREEGKALLVATATTAEAAATAEASATAEAAAAEAAATARTTTATATLAASAAFTLFATAETATTSAAAASKEVQTIAHMKHRIAGDGVHFLVAPSVGIDGTAEIGLLMQDVIPLQHHRECLSTQEAIAQLGIPYQLIGVERSIAVSALAIAMEVGRKDGPRRSIPWAAGKLIQVDACIATIVEVPSGEVTAGLQSVLRACVCDTRIQREVPPAVTIAE